MRDTQLNRDQRDELFLAMQRAGAEIAEFEIRADGIDHPKSGGRLDLELRRIEMSGLPSQWEVCAWPYLRSDGRVGQTDYKAMPFWPDVLSDVVPTWVAAVKKESEPDLWQQSTRGAGFVGAPEVGAEDPPFSEGEKEDVLASLQALETYLRNTNSLDAGQLTRLEEKIDRLTKAVDKLGKLSWRDMLVGGITSWAVAEGVSGMVLPALAAAAPHLASVYSGILTLPQ